MTAPVDFLELPPIERVGGAVRLPGSKSISNRSLLLAALAEGDTRLRDVLSSDDTRHMLEALRVLGVEHVSEGPTIVLVRGTAGAFPVGEADLFLGNAGTAFRPLTAVLGVLGGHYRLSGVPRMHERPVGDLVDALRSIGARIDYAATPGYPPLQIYPGNLDPGRGVRIRGNVSSQFVTALLMALPLIGRECRLEVEGVLISQPYVEMTLKTMELFGVKVDHEGLRTFIVPARQTYRSPGELFVEGDASAASYFLAAGLISGLKGGGPVRVEGVGLNSIQGDVRFTEVLEAMGGFVTSGKNWIEATASSEVMNRGRLRAFDMDLNHIPDAAMTAAVAALFAEGTSTLRNIGSWRVKETDRIAAMAHELRKLGAAVHEGPDYLRITAPERITAHAEIDTYDDHRIAMSFALAALAGVCIRINEPACVAKTFPEYFDVLGSISMVGGPS